MNKKQKKMLVRIIIAAVLLAFLNLVGLPEIPAMVLYFAAYIVIGYDILRKAGKGILNGRVFDENFLMAVATVGAIALAFISGSHDFNEAVLVMLFYQIGELFQSYAVGKSRRSISSLMDIRPDYANIEVDGRLEQVDPGESLPRDVGVGEEIISGCINLSGLIKVRTTKPFGESTVSKILELVENSGSRKSHSEQFISRFARVYTPIVCYAALTLAFLPPLVRILLMGAGGDWAVWIYRALAFLIVSCPCALVISIPLSFFAGLGGASSEGVLIKGSNYLEALAQTKTVVFDKTGTLTQGVFEVSGVHHCPIEDEKLIEYAALAECASSHPISKSLRRAHGAELDRSRVSDIEEISGNGVIAKVDGHTVAAGNDRLMQKLGIGHTECNSVGTIVHVAIDGVYSGHIVISDIVKPNSAKAISALKKAGVNKTVMLTGDAKAVADKVASELGVDEVHSQLLPGDKVSEVERLLGENTGKAKLAFVGDGINDAPVLSRADIGIAMGAMGSDAAIEAADVVLMDDDPLKISKAIKISRKCIRIVYENIIFALGVKFACLLLVALGVADMGAAIFADVGVMVIAVLNAMRALSAAH